MTATPIVADQTRPGLPFLIFRDALALAFIGAGAFKLSGQQAAIAEFAQVGFGQGLRYLTAALEITGAILLMRSPTIGLGALLLGAVCIGAFFAQLFALHGDVVHTIVLGVIFGAIALRFRVQHSLEG